MKRRHRRTYDAVFKDPVSATILWADIEALLRSLGAFVSEREGSRIAVELNGYIQVFHRPHPQEETSRGAVRAVRSFLDEAGVELGFIDPAGEA